MRDAAVELAPPAPKGSRLHALEANQPAGSGCSSSEQQRADRGRLGEARGQRPKIAPCFSSTVMMASAEAGPSSTSPLLRLLSDPSSSTLIKQGAEAKVYRSYPCGPASSSSPPSWLLKYRFPKTYRHPHLSQTITAQRTVSEARALVRCARYGVEVPVVELVDEKEGILALEWIEGASVREWLGGGAEDDEVPIAVAEQPHESILAAQEEVEQGVDLTPEEQREYARRSMPASYSSHQADLSPTMSFSTIDDCNRPSTSSNARSRRSPRRSDYLQPYGPLEHNLLIISIPRSPNRLRPLLHLGLDRRQSRRPLRTGAGFPLYSLTLCPSLPAST